MKRIVVSKERIIFVRGEDDGEGRPRRREDRVQKYEMPVPPRKRRDPEEPGIGRDTVQDYQRPGSEWDELQDRIREGY